MKNFLTKPNLKRETKQENGSSMIFALVLMIIAVSIVITVSAFALSNLQKTVFVQTYTNNGLAAETALSNAIMTANSPNGNTMLEAALSNDPLSANTVKGVVDSVYSSGTGTQKWVWYTTKISETFGVNKYYVHAIGYTNTPNDAYARHYRAVIESISDSEATFNSAENVIVYTPNSDAIAQWGMFGYSSATLSGNVKIKSYLSDETLTPLGNGTGFGYVSSNGTITVGKGSDISIDYMNLLNWKNSNPDRCQTAEECDNIEKIELEYATALTKITTTVQTECPLTTYTDWVASQNNGVLEPGCYSSLLFDQNTTIPGIYNAVSPAKVYVKGDITVNANITVNNDKSPLGLQIFSETGTNAVFNKGTSSTPTKFYGYLTGASLNCTDNTNNQDSLANPVLQIYGVLACNSLNFGGGTELWWDELTLTANGTDNEYRRIWYISKYEELYS